MALSMGVAIAMGLMVLANAVIGGSLLLLAARTRRKPELLIGLGLFCLGPISQLFSVLSGSTQRAVEDVSFPLHVVASTGSAVGMGCIFLFVRHVFRPKERWAAALTGLALATLAGALAWTLWAVATSPPGTPSAQALQAPGGLVLVLFTASFGWAALEAGIYHRRAVKQARVGLLEPVVVNRFLLWALASGSAFLLGAFLLVVHRSGEVIGLSLVPSVAICVVSLVTGTGMYLAFMPPRAYLAWVKGRAAAEPSR